MVHHNSQLPQPHLPKEDFHVCERQLRIVPDIQHAQPVDQPCVLCHVAPDGELCTGCCSEVAAPRLQQQVKQNRGYLVV